MSALPTNSKVQVQVQVTVGFYREREFQLKLFTFIGCGWSATWLKCY